MPTPNDFSDVRFTPQQEDYKNTALEQEDRDVFTKDNEPMLPGPAQGNYPRIFDRGYGPAETPAHSVYPDVYSDVRIAGTNPGSGEFGQCCNQPTGPYPGNNMVPDSVPSKQFSSNKEGDPRVLLQREKSEVLKHSDLVNAYGYNMPIATLGQHPWLRDSLADTTEMEPGAAQPMAGIKTPFNKDK